MTENPVGTEHPGAVRLRELLDGLDDVTSGPWTSKPMGGDSFVLAPKHKYHTRIENFDACPLSIPRSYQDWDEIRQTMRTEVDFSSAGFRHADADHIARCSPDAIREIAGYAEALEIEKQSLQDTIERSVEAYRRCDARHWMARKALLENNARLLEMLGTIEKYGGMAGKVAREALASTEKEK